MNLPGVLKRKLLMAWRKVIRGFEIVISFRDSKVKPTVLLSEMSKENSWNNHNVLWDPGVTPNAADKFALVISCLRNIASGSLLVFGPVWTGTREISTLSVWRTWLMWLGKESENVASWQFFADEFKRMNLSSVCWELADSQVFWLTE